MMLVPSHEWIMDRTERIVEESEELQATGVNRVNMFNYTSEWPFDEPETL